MAIDAYGIEALVADLANLDRATGEHLAPVAGVQPAALARQQRGGRGAAAAQRVAAALGEATARDRAGALPAGAGPAVAAVLGGELRLPAAYLALGRIAERTEAHSSTILLAAYVLMLARISGYPTTVVRMLVSNRFRPGFEESVAGLAQSALCVVDTADVSFDEVVARVWKTQLTAGMHAYYDPRRAVGHDRPGGRGARRHPGPAVLFNDRRRTMATAEVLPRASAKDINEALPKEPTAVGNKLRRSLRHGVLPDQCGAGHGRHHPAR